MTAAPSLPEAAAGVQTADTPTSMPALEDPESRFLMKAV